MEFLDKSQIPEGWAEKVKLKELDQLEAIDVDAGYLRLHAFDSFLESYFSTEYILDPNAKVKAKRVAQGQIKGDLTFYGDLIYSLSFSAPHQNEKTSSSSLIVNISEPDDEFDIAGVTYSGQRLKSVNFMNFANSFFWEDSNFVSILLRHNIAGRLLGANMKNSHPQTETVYIDEEEGHQLPWNFRLEELNGLETLIGSREDKDIFATSFDSAADRFRGEQAYTDLDSRYYGVRKGISGPLILPPINRLRRVLLGPTRLSEDGRLIRADWVNAKEMLGINVGYRGPLAQLILERAEYRKKMLENYRNPK